MIVTYIVRTIVIPLIRILKDLGIIILLTINTFSRERRTMMSSSSSKQQHGSQKDNRVFHHFPNLTPDLKVYILSFITSAPFEPVVVNSNEKTIGLLKRKITRSTAKTIVSYRSTLTNCLPYVNKEFYMYCTNMDIYWRQSLIRMITTNESILWTSALEHIVSIAESNNTTSSSTTCTNNIDDESNNDNNDKISVDYVLNYEDGDDDDDDAAGDDGIMVSTVTSAPANLASDTTTTTTNAAVPSGNKKTRTTTTTTKPEAVPEKLSKNTSTGSTGSSTNSSNVSTEVVQDSFLLDDASLKSFNVTIPPETVSLLHRAYKVIAQSAASTSTLTSSTTIPTKPTKLDTTKSNQAATEVDNTETETENVDDQVYNATNNKTSIYRELYKRILNDGLRHTGYPVFIMPSKIVLGQPYGLHLFEPRYRLLIAEVMRPYPQSARSGGPIPSSIQVSTSTSTTDNQQDNNNTNETSTYEPVFVHAFHHTRNGNSTDGTIGVLVRIVQCLINNGDGRANVLLLPYQYVWLEKLWVRPNTQNLVYCQSRILGQKEIQHLSNYYGLE